MDTDVIQSNNNNTTDDKTNINENTSDTQPTSTNDENNNKPMDNTQPSDNSNATPIDNTTIPSTNDSNSPNGDSSTISSGDSNGSNTSPIEKPTAPSSNDGDNTTTQPAVPPNQPTEPSKPEPPLTIDVYSYDYNGYFLRIDVGDKSPLDDTYLIPDGATRTKPPEVTEGKIQKWNGEDWDIVDIPKEPNKDESNEDTPEKLRATINKQQNTLNEYKDRIEALEQLVNGLIVSALNG